MLLLSVDNQLVAEPRLPDGQENAQEKNKDTFHDPPSATLSQGYTEAPKHLYINTVTAVRFTTKYQQ